MPVRKSTAEWRGTLKEGAGTMKLASGRYEGPYTYSSRFEEASGTNPEELLGAAFAGCYSMALAASLASKGFPAERINTSAAVRVAAGQIDRIELETEVVAPGIDEATFQELAIATKDNCPVGKALAAVPEITLTAGLLG